MLVSGRTKTRSQLHLPARRREREKGKRGVNHVMYVKRQEEMEETAEHSFQVLVAFKKKMWHISGKIFFFNFIQLFLVPEPMKEKEIKII